MRHSKTPAVQVLLVLLLLTAGGVVASSSAADDAVTLNLQQAVTKALANNPGIEAARIDANIAKARSETLALGTPWRLAGEIENVGGSGEFSGFDTSETTLIVARTLETGDKQLRRQNLGDSRLQLASIEIAAREAHVAAETTRRYVRLLQLQAASELSAESLAISNRTLDIVRRRVAVGRASEAEESSASVSLARTELESRRLGFEIVAAKTALSSLWGTTNPAFARVNGNLYSMPEIPDFERLREQLGNNPAMRRISAQSLVRQAEQRVAMSSQSTNVELSAGLRHLAASDDVAMVVGFSVPFGTKGRAAPLVRESDAGLARTSVDRDVQALELETSLRTLYQRLLAERNEAETLQRHVIPEAQRAVTFYERGFELGSYALLELTAAQERLVALRRDALDAATSFHLTLIEIESLLGNANPGGALL
jgi:cobalt-zinc-cadmium efflux system outer membrane protein